MSNYLTVTDVIRNIWISTKFPILNQGTSITVVADPPVFVHPDLKEIHRNDNAPYLIISAPGAVGKSTFAKYSANVKKGYYWDLSKIKLGTNTFVGTLVETFGHQNIGAILNDLSKGNITLFIDAFDEAEMISGNQGIENFLKEIDKICKNSPHPSIIIFSRTETTSMIQLIFEYGLNNANYSLFEIDYFNKLNAIQFIKSQLKQLGDTQFETHNIPFNDAIESIFRTICSGMNSTYPEAWEDPEIRSFIGYAPVLQTIAQYISKQNYEHITNQFINPDEIENGLKVISKFIEDLLVREQSKVIEGLKSRGLSIPNGWNDWENIYTWQDQIRIILDYLLNNRRVDLGFIKHKIPTWLFVDLSDAVTDFISNHPFLRNGEFSSPAFRDFILGNLIFDEQTSIKCESLITGKNIILTPLFAYFYKKANNQICYGNHVGLLYESASSKLGYEEDQLLTFIKPGIQGDYWLEIINPDNIKSQHLEFKCIVDEVHPLTFERRLHHATIDIQSNIVLGRKEGSIELSDVDLKCDNLEFRCKELTFNCYHDENCRIISNSTNIIDHGLRPQVIGDGSVKLNWPNAEYFPWSEFYDSKLTSIDLDYENEIYILKRILSPFRKHGKGNFAKHFAFIDNVIVGSDPLRIKLLGFLIQCGIIYKNSATNQYLISEDKLSALGLNWAVLKGLDFSDSSPVYAFLKKFKET